MQVDEAGHEYFMKAEGNNQSKVAFRKGGPTAIIDDIDDLLCEDPGLAPRPMTSMTAPSTKVTTTSTGNCYIKAQGLKCYGARGNEPSHGATDLEVPQFSSCGTMTVN